ncbi:MAG TPA: CocE/NonD family hydrolase [Gemmataceae bacterium]|nr:CocE/NonD family hydrolase [Gemmataceae bacterium]
MPRRLLPWLVAGLLLAGPFLAALLPARAPADDKADYKVKIDLGVRIPMRDGVKLVANVFRPDADGRFPVIVVRTPYGKGRDYKAGRWFARRGYAYVAQDCRGRHDSEGEFRPLRDEARDGYDTIEWAAAQPWSSGSVGTLGGSYLGWNQWLAATLRPPHLKCMVPLVSPPDPFYNVPYQYGAFCLMDFDWVNLTSDHDNQDSDELDRDAIYKHLPLLTMDEKAGRKSKTWREWVEHSTFDDYWKAVSYEAHYDRIDLPVLNISGWYDDDQPGTTRNFIALRKLGRKNQKLLMGPWPHRVNTVTKLGILDFGPSAQIDLRELERRWFDRWLKGVENGIDKEPPVRLFVMGANRWRDEDDWPPRRTRFTKYYFHSGGRANSLFGDGSLSTDPPRQEKPDRYRYNPERPTPFITELSSAQIGGPDDYRPVQRRDDVLVYTTEPMAEDMEVTGPVVVKLFAASSARDTDWTAMLLDVYPDGYALRLCDGVIRARYRDSLEKPTLLEPGKVYAYTIDCWSTSMVIKKGHRLRVQVASAAFPKFDRNPNTGHEPGKDAELRVADQTVYHDAGRPSHVVVPVVPVR